MATREQRRGYYNQYRICLKEANDYKKASRKYTNLMNRLKIARDKFKVLIDGNGLMSTASEACENLIISGERIDKGQIDELIYASNGKSVKKTIEEIENLISKAKIQAEENNLSAQAKTADAQHYFNLYRDSN